MSPSRRTGKEPVLWRCAQRDARWSAGCQAAHRGGEPPRATARRREPGGPAAKHRALPPCRTKGAHERDARRGVAAGRERGARNGGGPLGPRGFGGVWSARRRDAKARRGSDSKEKPKRVTMRTQVRHSLVLRFSGLRKAALPKVGIFDRMGKSIYSNL